MQQRSVFSAQRTAMLANGPLSDLRQMVQRIDNYTTDTVIIEKKDTQKIHYSAEKLCEDVRSLATALADMGLQGCNIALLGENSYRWIVAFLAITCSSLGTLSSILRAYVSINS